MKKIPTSKAQTNRDTIQAIRHFYLRGTLTLEDAKKIAQPIIDEMNAHGKEIAKVHGMKYKPITFTNLMR